MILPNKYTLLSESLIGLSAIILQVLSNKEMGIEKIWTKFDKDYIKNTKLKNPPNYQKFLYTLDFMYLSKMVNYNSEGEIYNENIRIEDNIS